MKCPDCHYQLKTIDFPSSKKDLKLKIIHCPQCGGYWLDSLTVNNLSLKEIKKLDKLTKGDSLSSSEAPLCPQCQKPLEQMKAESIPAQLIIFSCQSCDRKWFPAGQLLKFKKAQKTKLKYFKEWQIPLKSIFAILLPVLIIAPLAVVVLRVRQQKPAVYQLEPAEVEELISQPVVAFLGSGRVKISFATAKPCLVKIEYGLSKDQLQFLVVSDKLVTSHEIVLQDLLVEETYWYRLVVEVEGEKLFSSFYSFEIK